MLTQQQIADHVDISQQQVSELMQKLGIEWNTSALDDIRVAYIRQLRGVASGHSSDDGLDLTHERVLTAMFEEVDRQLRAQGIQVQPAQGALVEVAFGRE